MTPYVYDAALVDAYFAERQQRPDRRYYSVLLGGEVIGELVFKKIDAERKSCELGICLANDEWKNRGFGTAALRMALQKGFAEFGMETIGADSLLQNARSQHVLQKLGFRFTGEDEHFKYYQITREEYLASKGEKRE